MIELWKVSRFKLVAIFFSQVLEQKGGLSGSPAAHKTYETVPPVDLVEEKPFFYGKMS